MLTYQFDTDTIEIKEEKNAEDITFHIHILKPDVHCANLKKVYAFYEDNNVYTDVLFYGLKDHEYQLIVRKDYYEDFILTLMKFQILTGVTWSHESSQ